MNATNRILILDAHPNDTSFCRGLADAYERGARAGGAEVRRLTLGHLQFDPNLHHGYQQRTELEPDLLSAQQDILWAQHLVVVHPVWWGTYPALLKGFLDRTLLPGFAFQTVPGSISWQRLLAGRTGHILYTIDQPTWYYRLFNGQPSVKSLKRMVLEFCGVTPVRTTAITPIRDSTPAFRTKWIAQVEALGKRRA